MALVVMAFQAGGVSSAAVIVTSLATQPYPPGGYALLTVHPDGSLDPDFGSLHNTAPYAGVFYGTVGGDAAAFFCAELNHPIVTGVALDLAVNVLEEAPLHDGSPVAAPTPLSPRQLCLLEGVYAYLKVYNPNGYTANTGSQDLTGTSTGGVGGVATMALLTDLEATAAQLVMWEIIHEANTGTARFTIGATDNAISLTGGKLQWKDFQSAGGPAFDQTAFANEFNTIANYAVNTWVCVPEVTSPVALIAGGLVFMRRREPRALRLTKAAG